MRIINKHLRSMVSSRILLLKKELGLSYSEMALSTGVSPAPFWKMVNGKIQIPIEVLFALAFIYGVSCDWFFGLVENPKRRFAKKKMRCFYEKD